MIGGPDALQALIDHLEGGRVKVSYHALKSFEGDISDAVVAAMKAPKSETQLNNLMVLAGARSIKAAAPTVLNHSSKGSAIASQSLAGVVAPENADAVAAILVKAPQDQIAYLQNALSASLQTLTPAEQTSKVRTLMANSSARERFYPVLGKIGTDEAVSTLRGLSSQDPAAKEALLAMNNPGIIPDLLAHAAKFVFECCHVVSASGRNRL